MSKTLPLYVSKTSSVLIAWQNHITSERMVALISFLLNVVASLFKSKIRLEAENAALRHQLIVLQREVRGRVPFTNSDRLFFVQLYRWFPSVLDYHPALDACALASCRPRRIVAALRETIIAFFEAAMVEAAQNGAVPRHFADVALSPCAEFGEISMCGIWRGKRGSYPTGLMLALYRAVGVEPSIRSHRFTTR